MNAKVILVPLDGSTLAEHALEPAVACLRDSGRLILMRAAEGLGSAFRDATGAQVTAVTEAQEYLERVAARIQCAGARGVETMVWYGSPVEAIVDAARHCKAELIVMSSHGRSGLGRLLLGSIAESLLRVTSIPILLLRPDAPAEIQADAARRAPVTE
jgi:nucleotide-binding universal stress UspA family protein